MDELLAVYGTTGTGKRKREEKQSQKKRFCGSAEDWKFIILRLGIEIDKLSSVSGSDQCIPNKSLLLNSDQRNEHSKQRTKILDLLNEKLNAELNNSSEDEIRFQTFGSTASGLFLEDSDVDCNLSSHTNQPNSLLILQRIIQKEFPAARTELKKTARVPVLQVKNLRFNYNGKDTFFDADFTHTIISDEEFFKHMEDITNWTVTHIYSEMGQKYKVDILCRIIKAWSKDRDINSTFCNTLPSLAYLVMFFSTLDYVCDYVKSHASGNFVAKYPAIDKILERLESLDISLEDHIPAIALVSFFARFCEWNKNECIRTRDCVGEDSLQQIETFKEAWPDVLKKGFGRTVFIQDPFHEKVNLGRFITRSSFTTVIKVFTRAMRIITNSSFPSKSSCKSKNEFSFLASLLPQRCFC